jgi:protein-tyrosine phosphatase
MRLAQAIDIRESETGSTELCWTAQFTTRPVDIFAGRHPDHIDMTNPLARGARESATVTGLAPQVRHFFSLQPEGEAGVVAAQRNVPLDGSVNFRDLGGYLTTDNTRLKWGKLYRSGHLANLAPTARDYFTSLEIKAVCDFRQTKERASEAMDLPNNPQVDVLEIPPGVKEPRYLHRVLREAHDSKDVLDAVHAIVLSMVNESAHRYKRLFEVLLAPEEQNILINCSAGKERTGVASALILTALGVPRETIYYDFMLSKTYFPVEREIPRVVKKYDVGLPEERLKELLRPLLDTHESYLRCAFDFIDENFGDGLTYLQQQYDVGPAELRALRQRFTG